MIKCGRRKKLIWLLIMGVFLMSISPFGVQAIAGDITGHWAKDVIEEWMEKGLANGYPDGTFRPKNDIARAEFMSLVNNAFGYGEEVEVDFTDLLEDKWYVSIIKKAKAAGYISGYADGTVKPNSPITREEVAAIIARIMELEPYEKGIEGFKDKDKIGWSKGYVGAVAKEKYMVGSPEGDFMPHKNITRGEAIYALNNIIGKGQTKEVHAIAKQDLFGVTYIHVSGLKKDKSLELKANNQDLIYDESDGKWKLTSLDLEIGDEVTILINENEIEKEMVIKVKDMLDN